MYFIRFRGKARNAVRIHREDCHHAMTEMRANAKTEWQGPFGTRESAVQFAKEWGVQ